jgi:uncharacterized membrane protein YjjP (DUF1212 family)
VTLLVSLPMFDVARWGDFLLFKGLNSLTTLGTMAASPDAGPPMRAGLFAALPVEAQPVRGDETTMNEPPAEDLPEPVRMRHRDLEKIAIVALRIGCVLMECGASVGVLQNGMMIVARGLGAECPGVRVGYASIALTVAQGEFTITRMTSVGAHGVNHRLDMAVRKLAARIADSGVTVEEAHAELDRLIRETPRHPAWLVALATGVGCAAFAQLLGGDWASFAPVLVGAATGQTLRRALMLRGVNPFVGAAIVAFVAGSLGGWGARLAGSTTVDGAILAATLLLVPGAPATNAQTDIMEGFPTIGSARIVSVAMVMVFAATGIWFAQAALRAAS